jgi:predicted adenine nucleotide alpha hydrolase (AANH) superfamily ATPase
MSEVSNAVPRPFFDDVFHAVIIIYNSGERERRCKKCISMSLRNAKWYRERGHLLSDIFHINVLKSGNSAMKQLARGETYSIL